MMYDELYVFKFWNLMDRHIIRQTKRGKKSDRHFTYIGCRELHFALQFDIRSLTNA